jgi:hypothetical protein
MRKYAHELIEFTLSYGPCSLNRWMLTASLKRDKTSIPSHASVAYYNTFWAPSQCQRLELIHSNLSIMHAAPHIVHSAPFPGLVSYLTVEDHTDT